MNKKYTIQFIVSLIIGLALLLMAAYQWYDLHQIEQGLKTGSLSTILHKIYEVAGKWGVAGFYMPFAIYCFWRANSIYKIMKISEGEESGSTEEDN